MSVNPPDDKKPPEPSPQAKAIIIAVIVLSIALLTLHFYSDELASLKQLVMRMVGQR